MLTGDLVIRQQINELLYKTDNLRKQRTVTSNSAILIRENMTEEPHSVERGGWGGGGGVGAKNSARRK